MLLDRDQLLLAEEAVPAAEALGLGSGVGVIRRHVLAHDLGGVARDVEAGGETVLQPHTRGAFGIDRRPWGSRGVDRAAIVGDAGLIGHWSNPVTEGFLPDDTGRE